MSKGPGQIERRIADLFAATRDRALSVDAVADNAYELGGREASREQRLSATRAAHRLLRRIRQMDAKADGLREQAHRKTRAALGLSGELVLGWRGETYREKLWADPAWLKAEKIETEINRVGIWSRLERDQHRGVWKADADFWCASRVKGRLLFHPPDVPVEAWAVEIDRNGVHWFAAEITRVTERNIMVRYRGQIARLDRYRLWQAWAWFRGVRFVSSRTGRIASMLDEVWFRKYGRAGGVPPKLQMPLEQARLLLGLGEDYTRADIVTAFRKKAKAAHPDLGGTAEVFRMLVEARDRLLAAIGSRAAPRNRRTMPRTASA